MKLKALASLDRGDRDLADARMIAAELGIGDIAVLQDLYISVHREAPNETVRRRLAAVLKRP